MEWFFRQGPVPAARPVLGFWGHYGPPVCTQEDRCTQQPRQQWRPEGLLPDSGGGGCFWQAGAWPASPAISRGAPLLAAHCSPRPEDHVSDYTAGSGQTDSMAGHGCILAGRLIWSGRPLYVPEYASRAVTRRQLAARCLLWRMQKHISWRCNNSEWMPEPPSLWRLGISAFRRVGFAV